MKRRPNKPSHSGPKSGRPKNPAEPPPPLSPRRKWLFRLGALVILPLLLAFSAVAVLELGLRAGGYGYNTRFFRPLHTAGGDYLLNNEKFSLRFFPGPLARWPDPFKMAAVKPADTIRIFVFGESAAMGDPQPSYGASRYMEAMLRQQFPHQKFEVINLGITAIDSHVILPIARECAARQGDSWIIYMGNNEMVGPFGAATVFGARALPRWAAQLNLAMQRLRVGQLFVAALRHFGGGSKNASWGGMEMFLENQIAPGDPRKETVYRNFAGNLRDIVSAGVNSGAHVVLNTVSVNLRDCPPFASFTDTHLPLPDRQEFEHVFAQGKSLQTQSNFTAAAAAFAKAVKLEPAFAEAHFRLAQCQSALAQPAAVTEFQAACDLDALPFRADTRINSLIRQESQAHAGPNLVLADAEAAIAQAGSDRSVGNESFFEHVHFNFDGNYRLGQLWARQITQALAASGLAPASTNWPTQIACERDLGLTIWNRQFVLQSVLRRLGAPPLSTQFNNDQRLQVVRSNEYVLRLQEAEPTARETARRLIAGALQKFPGDSYLYEGEANFCEAVKEPAAAIEAYQHLLDLRPDDFYACLQLGRLLGEQKQFDRAEPLLKRAAELRPALPDAWFERGNVLAAQSQFEPARQCMETAARLRPQDSSCVIYAGQLLAKLGRHSEALEHFQRAARITPHDWDAHFELAGELVAANRPGEAIPEYATAIKLSPGHVVSHINLGVVLVRLNRLDEAIACFQDALKLDPENHIAQDYLNSVLAHKNRPL